MIDVNIDEERSDVSVDMTDDMVLATPTTRHVFVSHSHTSPYIRNSVVMKL